MRPPLGNAALMCAPKITDRSPLLTVPYFSLDVVMENPKKRIFDQLLSGDKDDQALQKKKTLLRDRDVETSAGLFSATGGAT